MAMLRMAKAALMACALGALMLAPARAAHATEIKTLGKLDIAPNTRVMVICTDPVVQRVISDDLRAHAMSDAMSAVTVTVSTRVLAPGVSLQEVSPGDPSVAEMLKDLGAEPPPMGDSGNKISDPYAELARRQATRPDDPLTGQFRNYQALKQSFGALAPTPYDNLPQNQIYDTAIIARATVGGSPSQFKVVAIVHPGDDVRRAKELVAEEIANAILH
jgi:hypothetical protein